MKNILWLLLVICIILSISNLQAQWVQTNGPYGGCVNDLILVNSILLSGNAEGMFSSSDDGSSWNKITLDIITEFDSFRRFGRIGSRLFVATSNKGVFLSTNGGSNWTRVNNGLTDLFVFTLLVSDTNLFVGTEHNGIFVSTNGGTNWSVADQNLTGTQVISLEKLGSNLFAGTNKGIFRSSDGGINWIPSDSGLPVTTNGVFSFCSFDSLIFCVIDGIGVFRSADSGLTWTQSNSGLSSLWCLHKIFTIDSRVFVNTCSGIYCSTDDGDSWNPIEFPKGEVLCCYPIGPYIFVGTNNGIYRSLDNGTTWAEVSHGLTVPVRCIAKSDINLYAGTRSGGIFLTSNNGATWSHLADCTAYVDAIAATDTTIFASNMGSSGHGPDGDIFRSTDKGKTWWTVNSGLTTTNVPALVISDDFIFAGTLGARVFRSINNGNTWTYAGSDITNDTIWSLAATATNLYAGTNDGVFRSTDDGVSWNQIGLTGNSINSLAASDSMIIAQAWPDGLCISTDNGATWSTLINLSKKDFSSVVESRSDRFTKTSLNLADINALAVSNGYLFAGTSQSIWKIPISQITVVNITDQIVPTIFHLDQNYPNPFNPSTTISFTLPFRSFVTLKVFDLLGREISTIVSEEMNAGTYTRPWNALAFPSGVYFYQLQAGSFVETKKLVLLR